MVWFCAIIICEIAGFLGIIVIVQVVENIAGWSMCEVCMKYAYYMRGVHL